MKYLISHEDYIKEEKTLRKSADKLIGREKEIPKDKKPTSKEARELDSMFDAPFNDFVERLATNVKNPKFRTLINMGERDGLDLDEQIKINTDSVFRCHDLIPTQSEIGIEKLFDTVNNDASLARRIIKKDMSSFIQNRLLIGNDKFILDGHHRWALISILNPKNQIPCIDIQVPSMYRPEDMLKVVQLTIAATYGELELKDSDVVYNLWDPALTKDKVKKLLPKVMKPALVSELASYYAEEEGSNFQKLVKGILKLIPGAIMASEVVYLSENQQTLITETTDAEAAAAGSLDSDVDIVMAIGVADVVLDVIGILDPTPITDIVHGITYFLRGDWIFGCLCWVSAFPYVGDALAKPFKYAMKTEKWIAQAFRWIKNLFKMDDVEKGAALFARIYQKVGEPVMSFLESIVKWGNKICDDLMKAAKNNKVIKFFEHWIEKVKKFMAWLAKVYRYWKKLFGKDPWTDDEVYAEITKNILKLRKLKPATLYDLKHSPRPLGAAAKAGFNPESEPDYIGLPQALMNKMQSAKINFRQPFLVENQNYRLLSYNGFIEK